jgi:hypothetical protein
MDENRKPKEYPRDTQRFRDWLDSIPYGEYEATLARIREEAKVNQFKIQNWRNGTGIKPLEKDVINRIAGYDIFTEQN